MSSSDVLPKAYKQLRDITTRLEKHYKDVQDFEFTIQDERLFMLQTRSGKRTGYAAVVIATDLVAEKLLTPKEAILLVDPEALNQLLAPGFDQNEWKKLPTATTGLPASPGAASGQVVFSADHAVEWANQGKQVILVRRETVPDDIHGMFVAQGILTATGGMTSHAAVVGRQMGKPSIVGAGELEIDEKGKVVPDQGPHGEGRRLHFLQRAHWRGQDRAGRVEAERDSAGARRHAASRRNPTSISASRSCSHGPTSSGDWASAPTPTCQTRPSSPTSSARAASASAGPSTCSSARGASRSSRR